MNAPFRSALLTAAVFAGLAVGPATAREPDASATTSVPATDPVPATDGVTTGSIRGPTESREKRLEDCMAIWEPATHMTKKQWQRTCVNQLDEEPNL